MDEADSRGIPYTAAEFTWAHERPARHRTPLPAATDNVLYRHDAWATPVDAAVVWAQPSDDVDDPHLWVVQTDEHGRPVMLHGRPLLVPRPDPWPTLRLKTRYGLVDTREARLRGSPGWLPLDWAARHRPVPEVSNAQLLPRYSGLPSAPFAPAAARAGAGEGVMSWR